LEHPCRIRVPAVQARLALRRHPRLSASHFRSSYSLPLCRRKASLAYRREFVGLSVPYPGASALICVPCLSGVEGVASGTLALLSVAAPPRRVFDLNLLGLPLLYPRSSAFICVPCPSGVDGGGKRDACSTLRCRREFVGHSRRIRVHLPATARLRRLSASQVRWRCKSRTAGRTPRVGVHSLTRLLAYPLTYFDEKYGLTAYGRFSRIPPQARIPHPLVVAARA